MAAPSVPAGFGTAPFHAAVVETFALVTRRGTRVSPAAEDFAAGLREHMLMLGLEPT